MKHEEIIQVNRKEGLEPRKMSEVVRLANTFSSNINIEYKGYNIDAKSIMGLLSLLIKNGDKITLKTEGHDAKEAFSKIASKIAE